MRFACSLNLQIACGILLLSTCVYANPKIASTSEDGTDGDLYSDEDPPKSIHHRKKLEDEIDLNDAFNSEQLENEQLPFLPPIILLDFVNNTDDSISNSTDQSDEKAKRTIDGSLGYGFNRNNLFSGKHNYYFPAGKTGTAVSIEESISPFEPQTVTEIIKPVTETSTAASKDESNQTELEALPDPLPLQNHNDPTPIYPPYPVFGQRKKLHKISSSSDFGYQGRPAIKQFSNSYTTAATPGSESYNKLLSTYTSLKPNGYHPGLSGFANSANINGYARPMTSPYLVNYMTDTYTNENQKTSSDSRLHPTASPSNKQEFNFANYPRYTIENGIKYEHKIVWKYPDGKISETPPMSYVNSYSDYTGQQSYNTASTGGFQPSTQYQTHSSINQQHENTQAQVNYNPYSAASQSTSNIYSQRPVQFPTDQDQSNGQQLKDQSRFVSMVPQSGNHYANPKVNNYRPITSKKNQYNTYPSHHRTVQKYMTNSPNPEFSYNGELMQNENLFLADGQINKQALSKYSPEAQSYLMKVFSTPKAAPPKTEYRPEVPENYANSDYSNLLNYNPSISQYIKNPSSILNAQPTFVQAGNSLIPVIILRVDGAPPIQPKAGSNINLKSLLRQYLTQYANSVSRVSENTNYDLGEEKLSASPTNPVEDLKYLTESLASFRQRGQQNSHVPQGSYLHNYKQVPASSTQHVSGLGQDYNTYIKDYQKLHTGQVKNPKQKVKSVQIIEDPRYTSYKVDN